ncbi:MAG: NAD-dependent epimerase/dehydratase family protein, partial [Chromatiales bacterium]|nr:NAD-dependent epimerase/dehydratase family protein [Chromatiales bacterium]
MSRILIAGCGDVGTALGLALAEHGHEVFGARRSAHRLPEPLRPLPVDLTDARAIERAIPTVDAAVYAVAAGSRDEGAYRRAYVDGVSALLEVLEARAESPRRVFFVSSTSVYGERGGEWIDETAPLAPRGFAGESL